MANITVQYRYYAYDDGHHHWTDDYVSFSTMEEAQSFMAELEQRIAGGDYDVKPGVIVTPDDMPSYRRRTRRFVDPTF